MISRMRTTKAAYGLLVMGGLGAACSSSSGGPDTVRDAATSSGRDAQSARPDGSGGGDATYGGEDTASGGGKDAAGPGADDDAQVPERAITRTLVYVGGYGADYPVRTFELRRQSGMLSEVGTATNLGKDPSYITPSADGRFLYVANESGGNAGGVTVAALDAAGAPSKIDREPVVNGGFVFASLSPNGKYLLTASYNGASASVFPVTMDGSLGTVIDTEYFAGGSQAHSIRVHPSGKWAFVPKKGGDAISQLTFDPETGMIAPNTTAERTTDDGAGPRHLAFSRDGKLLFVIHELSSEVQSYAVQDDGTLTPRDKLSSLPADFKGPNSGAHILVHPKQDVLYVSNRGHNSLAAFSFDESGMLTLLEHEPARGDWPRNFDIDDAGELLVVAHQYSGSLAVLSVDGQGRLSPLGEVIGQVLSPAAVAIINTRE